MIRSPRDIIKELDKKVVGQKKAKEDLALLAFMHSIKILNDKEDYYDMLKKRQEQIRKAAQEDANTVHVTYKSSEGVEEYAVSKMPNIPTLEQLAERTPFDQYTSSYTSKTPTINGLVTGPTGCGKTYLVEQLAEMLKLPIIKVPATELTAPGWKGLDFGEALNSGLKEICKKFSPEAVMYAIVFVDEFDKLCVSGSTNMTGHNKMTQNSLLKAVEGGVSYFYPGVGHRDDGAVPIPTDRFLFIFGGSFQHMRDAKHAQTRTSGFAGAVAKDKGTENVKYTVEDLITNGMVKELAGRIGVITEVLQLTDEEMNAAMDIDNGALDLFRRVENKFGVSFDMDSEDFRKQVIKEARDLKLGARGLRSAIMNHLHESLLDLTIEDLKNGK